MNTSDYEGLRPTQILRIERLQMTRYRKKRKKTWITEALIILAFCLWIGACATFSFLNRKPAQPTAELTTSLPSDLNQQEPSITIRP